MAPWLTGRKRGLATAPFAEPYPKAECPASPERGRGCSRRTPTQATRPRALWSQRLLRSPSGRTTGNKDFPYTNRENGWRCRLKGRCPSAAPKDWRSAWNQADPKMVGLRPTSTGAAQRHPLTPRCASADPGSVGGGGALAGSPPHHRLSPPTHPHHRPTDSHGRFAACSRSKPWARFARLAGPEGPFRSRAAFAAPHASVCLGSLHSPGRAG